MIMNLTQSSKLWFVVFSLAAFVSVALTLSLQAINDATQATTDWQTSSAFAKNDDYYTSLDELKNSYENKRLLKSLISQPKADDKATSATTNESLLPIGVALPGGGQLLGIVSEDGKVYAILTENEPNSSVPTEFIEAHQGHTLQSGYTVKEISASAITLQFSSEQTITIELYQ